MYVDLFLYIRTHVCPTAATARVPQQQPGYTPQVCVCEDALKNKEPYALIYVYGLATIRRLLKITDLFCKRAL